MTTLILPTNPTRAYISLPHCRRHEVIVRDSYITPDGVMIARVQYLGDSLDHAFDIEASKVEVEFTAADAAE